jgi:hypothetical protein
MSKDINITQHQIRNINTCPERTDELFLTFHFFYILYNDPTNAQLTDKLSHSCYMFQH